MVLPAPTEVLAGCWVFCTKPTCWVVLPALGIMLLLLLLLLLHRHL
jgi:hypothetical protein